MLRLAYEPFKKSRKNNFSHHASGSSRSVMLDQLLKFFVVFFLVVEPLSLIPLFNGLTDGASRRYKHKMALKAVLVSGLILLLFALGGAGFLGLAGISLDAFRIF